MPEPFDDLCPRPPRLEGLTTEPLVPPLFLSTVYRCSDPDQAEALLAGQQSGFVYSRDGHPNAQLLAARCGELHGAASSLVCSSGMSALAVALLSQVASGEHVVASRLLYGRSLALLVEEAGRLGIGCTTVDTCDLEATAAACTPQTRLVVAETITNPLLRVSDVARLAEVAHRAGAALVIDNTLAGPGLCRPLALGADLVVESLTKSMNGHSDVLLGLLCARDAARWQRVPQVASTWGMSAGPFECWLAARGIATLGLRIPRACENALAAAEYLAARGEVERVHYPGLAGHRDHALAAGQFAGRFGTLVTFDLAGGDASARRLIAAARQIPFCPSLGELSTTLSHPATTSHRGLSAQARADLGIGAGTIRLSLGIESTAWVRAALDEALRGIG